MKQILISSLKFAVIITAISLISLPIMIGFASDKPGTTQAEIFFGLSKFYLIYVFGQCFIMALLWNSIKTYIKNR